MKLIHSALLAILILVLGLTALSCKKKSNPVAPGGGADVTIDIVADMGSGAFGSSPVTVNRGQTVAWRNTRGTTHTSTADGGAWNTGNIAPGATSAAIQMNTAGSFPYHCIFHPTMVATLVVNP
jgi:plastocyanin